jgi:Flp pilus assembly protein protease CpaA
VLAVGVAIYRGALGGTLRNVCTLLQHHASEGLVAHTELHVQNSRTIRLPYAIAIAIGCLAAVGPRVLLGTGL